MYKEFLRTASPERVADLIFRGRLATAAARCRSSKPFDAKVGVKAANAPRRRRPMPSPPADLQDLQLQPARQPHLNERLPRATVEEAEEDTVQLNYTSYTASSTALMLQRSPVDIFSAGFRAELRQIRTLTRSTVQAMANQEADGDALLMSFRSDLREVDLTTILAPTPEITPTLFTPMSNRDSMPTVHFTPQLLHMVEHIAQIPKRFNEGLTPGEGKSLRRAARAKWTSLANPVMHKDALKTKVRPLMSDCCRKGVCVCRDRGLLVRKCERNMQRGLTKVAPPKSAARKDMDDSFIVMRLVSSLASGDHAVQDIQWIHISSLPTLSWKFKRLSRLKPGPKP